MISRGEPEIGRGTGIYSRIVIPDRNLRANYRYDAPITQRMNTDGTISRII